MKRLITLLLPLLVLVAGIIVMVLLFKTAPEPKRVNKPAARPVVETLTLAPADYEIKLQSQGTLEPRTQSQLVTEVRGRITQVGTGFVEGGFFKAGDLLLRLDDKDYLSALAIAQADLAQAQVQLSQEIARAEQATKDWERLGGGEASNDLVTRKAFVDSAKASVAAAKARVTQAKLDLARTQIHAPYAGRIQEKLVDVGQFVNVGTPLARIFAVDYAEAKLPLTAAAFSQVDLAASPEVTLSTNGRQYQAQIDRMSATVDPQSRQKSVVVRVHDPYGLESGRTPLEIGSFVEAEIPGRHLSNVYVIPASAVREGRFVLLETQEKLHRVPIDPVWATESEVIVADGLKPGQQLITTALPYAVEGMSVKVSDKK